MGPNPTGATKKKGRKMYSLDDILKDSSPPGLYVPEDGAYLAVLKDSEGCFFVQKGIKQEEIFSCSVKRYKLREKK